MLHGLFDRLLHGLFDRLLHSLLHCLLHQQCGLLADALQGGVAGTGDAQGQRLFAVCAAVTAATAPLG
ncbi:hypothetical protein TW86_08740 [Halomonas sp. S2151]|nr:hypothetical protein TW86_08740 [Halomonas sp. S2151]